MSGEAICLLIFGIFIFIIGMWLLISNLHTISETKNPNICKPVEAIVTDFDEYVNRDNQTINLFVVSYEVDGRTYTKRLDNYSGSREKNLGKKILLYYKIGKPEELIDPKFEFWAIIIIFMGVLAIWGSIFDM